MPDNHQRLQAIVDIKNFYGLECAETLSDLVEMMGFEAFTDEALIKLAQLQRDRESRLFRESERRRRYTY